MAEKFDEAPAVEAIANELIEKYHRHLIDFSVNIKYVFVNKTPKSKGREIWGTCRKITGHNAFLAKDNEDGEPFFLITISRDVWDVLPEDKRIALVDHELCHAWAEVKQAKEEADVPQDEVDDQIEKDNPVKLSVKPHDLEEFSCIVKRHGLWRESIEEFVEAALKSKGKDTADEEDEAE
jgi:predicted metallopeptidase